MSLPARFAEHQIAAFYPYRTFTNTYIAACVRSQTSSFSGIPDARREVQFANLLRYGKHFRRVGYDLVENGEPVTNDTGLAH